MSDVAAAAGVSLKTVSRVVNDEPGVRRETAAVVQPARASSSSTVRREESTSTSCCSTTSAARELPSSTCSHGDTGESASSATRPGFSRRPSACAVTARRSRKRTWRRRRRWFGWAPTIRTPLQPPSTSFCRCRPPTALFAGSNRITVGVLRALARNGLSLALVGFDDVELGEMLAVPVTVVAYDAADLGRAAAELVARRLADDQSPPQRVVLPTTLVVQRSTA
jgi:substrate-binding family protein